MNGQCAAADVFAISLEQLDVGRTLIEVVVADEAAERLAAELAVLGLVDALEERALIPGRAFVALERLAQFLLGDVHDTRIFSISSVSVLLTR